jgi:AcrR family transcriptional regulator
LPRRLRCHTGTEYNYFRTREEIVDAVALRLADDLSEQQSQMFAGLEEIERGEGIHGVPFQFRISSLDWVVPIGGRPWES